MTKVPGWIDARLDELVEVLDSRRIPVNSAERDARIAGKRAGELYPYYGATGRVGSIDDFLFDEPLVLLGEDGVPFLDPLRNKAYLIEGRSWVNNHAHVLRAIAQIADHRYVSYCLNGYDYTGVVTGSTRLKLTQAAMREMRLPLPPMAEQKRIADKLDALLARVDACRDRLDRVPAILKRFRQSVLTSAARGDLTSEWRGAQAPSLNGRDLVCLLEEAHESAGGHKAGNASPPTEGAHDLHEHEFPDGWGMTTLRSAVLPDRPITYGILKPGPELAEGVPYVRVADFPNDRLNLTGVRKTSAAIDAEFKRSRLRAGDLLLSIRGTVGRLIVIPPELENANITQDSARISVQPLLSASFVPWFLRSEMAQSRMRRAVKGVAVRGLNIGDVRALQLPIPSRAEQEEIVRRVEALFALADTLEARVATARAQVERLTPALLSKAFRGELVPQDPNDEPASALLARIRQSGASASDSAREAPASKANRGARGKRAA
ncbi:MAG: restriction endonuclease subunit S [Rubrivivax sp.]|nr:restriction endonuclease subunit S [Rubrivivax sp.]